MAAKQHSKTKKTCNSKSFTSRSEWAAWMNGAPVDWLHSEEASALAKAFDGKMPQWLIDDEPWYPSNPERFKFNRHVLLRLTVDQCAAFLRVSPRQITMWESGKSALPHAALEALRLLYKTNIQHLSHGCWDGWFINRATGELMSPDVGNLGVKPEEINRLPSLYKSIAIMKEALEQQREHIAVLQSQNAELRGFTKVREVVAELGSMQDRISEILASVATAEVIPFQHQSIPLGRDKAAA